MGLVSLFLGIILLGGGLWGLFNFFQNWQASNVQRRWERVEGTITRAELERLSPRNEPDSIAMFGVNIIYMYTVGDKNYRGEVTDDDLGVIHKQRGDQLMTEFAKGNQVEVYYNPAHPNISTLFPAADSRLYYKLVFIVVAIVLGTGMLIAGWRL